MANFWLLLFYVNNSKL